MLRSNNGGAISQLPHVSSSHVHFHTLQPVKCDSVLPGQGYRTLQGGADRLV
jgi:hypothetical protein